MNMKEIREKYLAPLQQAAQRLFGSEDGKLLLDACERAFCDPEGMIEKDKNGAVDPNAILINVGSRRVIDYLRKLAAEGQGDGK